MSGSAASLAGVTSPGMSSLLVASTIAGPVTAPVSPQAQMASNQDGEPEVCVAHRFFPSSDAVFGHWPERSRIRQSR